jgi:uncharacterized protein YjfI (DUF2170 family)
MDSVNITTRQEQNIREFLEGQDFFVEQVTEKVIKVQRDGELPVFVHREDNNLYFEVDLLGINDIEASQELYFQLLDLNTEILPVSSGVDSSDPDNPRLVLVESREVSNLDHNELLSVFNALELAVDRVESILANHMEQA